MTNEHTGTNGSRDGGVESAPSSSRSHWKWLLITAGLLVVTNIVVLSWETRPWSRPDGYRTIRFPDEQNCYMKCANQAVEEGREFFKNEDVLRSPPVPWLWLWFWRRDVALARFANIALSLIGAFLVSRIVDERYGHRCGLLAFALCAGGYQVVYYSGTVLSEPLALFFACLFLWTVHRMAMTGKYRFAVMAGIACGFGAISRTSFQLFPFFYIAVSWLLDRLAKQTGRTRRPAVPDRKHIMLLLTSYLVFVAPWMVHNYIVFGVARIANGSGAVMYLGSDFRTNGDEPVFSGMQWQTGAVSRPYTHLQTRGDKLLMQAAVENIRRHPIAWGALCVRKIWRTLIGGPMWHFFGVDHYQASQRIHGRTVTALRFAWWTVGGTFVTVFGLWGLVLLLREHRAIATAGLALILYFVALHAVTYAMPRFGLTFYPALALGCSVYLAAKRRRALTILLSVVCVVIIAHLALYHYYIPRCITTQEKLKYFTLDQTWRIPGDAIQPIVIDAAGMVPPFNACLFIRATAQPQRDCPECFGILYLRTNDTKDFDEGAEIWFPLLADGREHVYQFCIELQQAWRSKPWQALKLVTVPPGSTDLQVREVVLAH